jgi:xanthine dehydrogenase accessory factor
MNAPATPRSRAAIAPEPSPEPSRPGVGWLKPLRDWPQALLAALEQEPAVVRILVTQVLGSAPREAGVCMLVGREQFQGTIGGGQLEWQALAAARLLLAGGEPAVRMQRIVLAADAAQCCGGVVQLWMQRYTRADRSVLRAVRNAARCGTAVLISTITTASKHRQGVDHQIVTAAGEHPGADPMLLMPRHQAMPRVSIADATGVPNLGPVASERATLMERLDEALPALWLYADLPLELTWIDPRAQLFPKPIPDSVRSVHAIDPLATVAVARVGTHFVVLTHSHALDYALCRAILQRGDFASLGLIGSNSKGARFRSRLARDGLSPQAIARLRCPIGAGAIASKWPAAIAVAVAFDLLREIGGEGGAPLPASAPATSAPAVMEVACRGCVNCQAADGNVADADR